MQITIQSITKGKEGESQHGHWTAYNLTFPELSIFEQNGKEHKFTKAGTFDKSAPNLSVGDNIDAEVEINDKGYATLKNIKTIAAVQTPFAPVNSQKPANTPTPPPYSKEVSIDRAVAIKAVTELACAGVLDPKHPLVGAVTNWCTEQLRNYLSMYPIDTPAPSELPKTEPKPPETQPRGKLPHASASLGINEKVDKEMLINSIKSRMKYTSDLAAVNWLKSVNGIPIERIENESDVVYQEMKTKYNWS